MRTRSAVALGNSRIDRDRQGNVEPGEVRIYRRRNSELNAGIDNGWKRTRNRTGGATALGRMIAGRLRRFVGHRHPGMMSRMVWMFDTRRCVTAVSVNVLHPTLVRCHV